MDKPTWFVLIEQWRAKGMGQYGITLPFLVGALAHLGRGDASVQGIRAVLQQMVERPFSGYVTEVRWCGQVDAPVFSVTKLNDARQMPLRSHFISPKGEVSLGFSQDLHGMFGLNCSGSDDCLEKLVAHATGPIESGRFSRVRNPLNEKLEFSSFLPTELQYIEEVADLAAD